MLKKMLIKLKYNIYQLMGFNKYIIANEWYGGYRNEDPLKYKRFKLAYI